MNKISNTTLVFLVKMSHGRITDICLAMKKRGFGLGRWNGVGGKVENGESIKAAAIREAEEEIDVTISKLTKVAELTFRFPHNPNFDQTVHVYLSSKWIDEPKESEEMNPQWFRLKDIPYQMMWPDDIYWLPLVLQGKLINANFTFGKNDVILNKMVTEVNKLSYENSSFR